MGALNIPRALLIAWASIASLGVAAIAVYHANTLGKLRTAQADLRESWRVNDSFSATLDQLRADLGLCERQFASARETAEADRRAREMEIQALESRLQETRNAIEIDLDQGGPELAACLDMPVPDPAYERLRAAADRAAGTGGSGAARMDPDTAGTHRATDCAGAPDHAAGVCG